MNRIVVVGASAAGLAAAETLRREKYTGQITLVGEELLAPYDRPPLSKQILASQWEAGRLFLRSAEQITALDLDLRLGVVATGLDLAGQRIQLSNGDPVSYDGLIIATGARPRRLPGEGAHVMRTLNDALALRRQLGPAKRLVVVGAGFLGAESAAVANALGCDVTLLEPAPVPLAQAVGVEIGQMLAQVHHEHGVAVRTGVAVASVTGHGVELSNGEFVAADEVLVAIGSRPNTEWLEGSGLQLEDGLVCDEYSQAATDVYGAGDVARWHNPLFASRCGSSTAPTPPNKAWPQPATCSVPMPANPSPPSPISGLTSTT